MSNPNNGPNVLQQILPESVTARIVAGSIAVSSVLGLGAAAELGPNASKATAAGTGENTPGLVADPASLQPEATPFANPTPEQPEAARSTPNITPSQIAHSSAHEIGKTKGRTGLMRLIKTMELVKTSLSSETGFLTGKKQDFESVVGVSDFASKGALAIKYFDHPGYHTNRANGYSEATHSPKTQSLGNRVIEATPQDDTQFGKVRSLKAFKKGNEWAKAVSTFAKPKLGSATQSAKKFVKKVVQNKQGKVVHETFYKK